MTKTEEKFVEMTVHWLADTILSEDVRTVVWNAISAVCCAIRTEDHDGLERVTAELQR